jgi:DNA-binding winged helix-turn-helix (wHTH) protein
LTLSTASSLTAVFEEGKVRGEMLVEPRHASTSHGINAPPVGDFEVDLRCGELRRNGDKIKLQERPFQVLTALIERPGEVVTRQEMQQKLWPTDTFVDFEHSINTAVKKLREALGDDAENPRFIETLPRRGYRLHRSG